MIQILKCLIKMLHFFIFIEKHDRLEMQNIYVELPDLEDSARRATRSTDENETRKGIV